MPKVGLPPHHEWTHRSGAYDAIAAALAAAAHPDYASALLTKHQAEQLQKLRTGAYYITNFLTTFSSAGKAITANRLYAIPFFISRPMTADRIGVQVATLAAGSLRLGLYADGVNLYPGALLLDAGVVDTGTTGLKELTINQALSSGLVWLAMLANAAPSLYQVGGANRMDLLGSPTGLDTANAAWYVAQTYGALPNPFPAAGSLDPDLWWLGLRFSSMD